MQDNKKIPVVVGVTGHRNIVEEDKPLIKAKVIESLKEIQNLCRGRKEGEEDTPVVMLNAFAQGADMLCAEAAFELGIDVYAVLPCEKERYIESFDDEIDKGKLYKYLSQTKRQFVAPDMEKNKLWIRESVDISDSSYEYRQLGIYVAEHSHILIALWDGNLPKVEYGCGTVEVINFALEHNYLNKDNLFKPGVINDSAVVWIKSRRQGDGTEADVCKKWLISRLDGSEEKSCDKNKNEEKSCDKHISKGKICDKYITLDEPPAFLKEIISKTVEYNAETVDISPDAVKLWKNTAELDEYRKIIGWHSVKAGELSYAKNQKKYNLFILLIAIIGSLVAFTFLIYDEASLPFMIFPCTVAILVLLWVIVYGNKKGYHKNYIEYRAFAEALRVQFYMSMCLTEEPIVTNVCDVYSWSQKVEMGWVEKAIQVLGVIGKSEKINTDPTEVIDVWLGNNEKPMGQLKYHTKKKGQNRKQAQKFARLSKIFSTATIVVYFCVFVMEIITYALKAYDITCFWDGSFIAQVSWRNFAAIALGTVAASSLLATSYWGKLSYDRKVNDNENMSKFYASACARWNEVKKHSTEIEGFVKEIAREEIVENGIWRSYVYENGLDINI